MMVKIKPILHARVPPTNGRVGPRWPPAGEPMREFEDFPVRTLRRPPRSREISPHFVRHLTPVVAKGRDAWATLQQAEGHLARVCARFADCLARAMAVAATRRACRAEQHRTRLSAPICGVVLWRR